MRADPAALEAMARGLREGYEAYAADARQQGRDLTNNWSDHAEWQARAALSALDAAGFAVTSRTEVAAKLDGLDAAFNAMCDHIRQFVPDFAQRDFAPLEEALDLACADVRRAMLSAAPAADGGA